MSRAAETPAETPAAVAGEAAPAKINLYLHVTGRRADGYHLLDSLVAFADIGDRLEAAPADGFSIRVTGPFAAAVPAGSANLVARAVVALAHHAGRQPNLALVLEKSLPVAAGIGGGSADAAAALRLLCRLWRIDPADPAISTLAARLGADVPVCLGGRAAFVGGIGELLAPAPSVSGVPILLVNPGVAVPTAEVFRLRSSGFSLAASPITDAQRLDAVALARLLRDRRNDLTGPASRLCPVIGPLLARLEGLPGCLIARLSGSGATCFGLFGTDAAAALAAETLAAAQPNWWVRSGRLL